MYCGRCGRDRPKSAFYKASARHTGYSLYCKQCWKGYRQTRDKKRRESGHMPERRSVYAREYHLQQKYGISIVQYNQMLIQQAGACAICGKSHQHCKQGLHVDHNHKTGKVRALLCHDCNTGIGKLQDSRELLLKALQYLDQYGEGCEVLPLQIVNVNR